MASSTVQVNNQSLATVGKTGYTATSGQTITISLLNTAGVNAWNINCTATDGYNPTSTIELVQTTKIGPNRYYQAQFTLPTQYMGFYGFSLQFTSNVNNDPTTTKTFGVYLPNGDGTRLFFPNENYETNATYGIVQDLNELMVSRLQPAVGSLSGDVQGAATSNTVVAIQNHPVSSTSPTTGQVLEWNGSTWLPSNPPTGFTAGEDLSGTSTAQQVIGLKGNLLPALADGYLYWSGVQWDLLPISGDGNLIYGFWTLQNATMGIADTPTPILLNMQLQQNCTTATNLITITQTGTVRITATINGTRLSSASNFNIFVDVTVGVGNTYTAPALINPVPISTNSYAFVAEIDFVTQVTAGQAISFVVYDTLGSGGSIVFSSVAETTYSGSSIVIQSITSATGGTFTAGGDLAGTSTYQNVVGLEGHTLPTLSAGYLSWNGVSWVISDYNTLIYQPGGSNIGNIFNNWQSIKDNLNPGCTVYIDCSQSVDGYAHIPANTGITDMTSVTLASLKDQFLSTTPSGLNTYDTLFIEDGAQLYRVKNISGFLGIVMDAGHFGGTIQSMAWDYTVGNDIIHILNCKLAMAVTAGAPGIVIPNGGTGSIFGQKTYFGTGSSAQPVFNVLNGGTLYMEVFTNSYVYADAIAGQASATMYFNHDDTSAIYQYASYLGYIGEFRYSQESYLTPSAGVTAGRPSAYYSQVGQRYFDTTLNRTVVWNGSSWVVDWTAGGDLSGTNTSQSVVSLTGASGAVDIAATGNILTWAVGTTSPGITQTLNPSGFGNSLTIAAQSATGHAGGILVLQGGSGTTGLTHGAIYLQPNGANGINLLQPGGGTAGAIEVLCDGDIKLNVASYTTHFATTDATSSTMFTYTIPSNTVINMDVVVLANANASGATTAGATYKLNAVYKNIGGTVTAIGATPQVLSTQADSALSTATAVISNSTTSLNVVVAGVAATNITWSCYVQVSQSGI